MEASKISGGPPWPGVWTIILDVVGRDEEQQQLEADNKANLLCHRVNVKHKGLMMAPIFIGCFKKIFKDVLKTCIFCVIWLEISIQMTNSYE